MQSDRSQPEQDRTARALLDVVRDLIGELHPRQARKWHPQLDSSLETDLRLDSLARVELIARLEQHFNIALPPQVFANAESPRDLLKAVRAAGERKTVVEHAPPIAPQDEGMEALPHEAQTLIDVLQ